MTSKISIKRINNEIKYFNEKKYLTNDEFPDSIIQFFENLDFYMKYNDLHDIYHGLNYRNCDEDAVHLKIFYNENFLVDLKIPTDYPFRSFNISKHHMCNNVNFNSHINKLSNLTNALDKNILQFFYIIQYGIKPRLINVLEKNTKCYCCSSITCDKNWSPGRRICDFLLEYNELMFIDKNTKKKTYKSIHATYTALHALYFHKLPVEIMEHIFHYLIWVAKH